HGGDLRLKPGTAARLSAWVRTHELQGRAYLLLYSLDAKGEVLAQPSSQSLTGTADWTELQVQATVPAGAAYVMPYLEVKGVGTAAFDDVVLTGEATGEAPAIAAPPIVFGPEDFWRLQGYEVVSRDGRSMLQIPTGGGAAAGEALLYVTLPSARYTVTVEYLDEPDGAATLEVLLNGQSVGQRAFDTTPATDKDTVRPWTLPALDIQRNSRLVLRGKADAGEYCRIVSVSFRPAGGFRGTLLPAEQLPPPPSLRVWQLPPERSAARAMLSAFVYRGVAAANARREERLAALQTPAQWRAYQDGIRARLADFFGPFPEKTPLNPKTVGTIHAEGYAIEKVIFQSRPRYYVTANFYRPVPCLRPVPGIALFCGHAAEGKGYHLYHETALGLVLKGYAVLAMDPHGQGERSEYFDPETLAHLVPLTVAQHHQFGRPAYLVGQTLSGHRTWDAIRAVDYLASRPEVDPQRLGATGNSGGGQMALLITAVDERIQVCAAGHPGGSQENTYLVGGYRDPDLLCLIAPRPCRFIVGKDSGEVGHESRMKDMRRFYRGLGVAEDRCDLAWVDGVHNMERPKRVAAYAWFNRWFGKPEAGADEPPLHVLTAQELWCTDSGFTLKSLGGESGVSLNTARLHAMLPTRKQPTSAAEAEAQVTALRQAVAQRAGARLLPDGAVPAAQPAGTFDGEGFTAEMLVLSTEEGVRCPAALLRPAQPGGPLVLHVSDRGKPTRADQPSLPLELCRAGATVLSLDVRGVGETDPRDGRFAATANGYDADNWARDSLAITAWAALRRTMAAMRAEDVAAAARYLHARGDLGSTELTALGEGEGGLWALLAAAGEPQIGRAVTLGTLASYRTLIENPYYELRGYFWIPEAPRDFDVVELSALAAPRPVAWLQPVDQMACPLRTEAWGKLAAWTASACRARGGRLDMQSQIGDGPAVQAAAVLAEITRAR
ncbi:acetylxylan esterase, partial [bacterium]|nr:acetylxylan esterase [bacterium]